MDINKSEEQAFHDAFVASPEVRGAEGRFYCNAARELEYAIAFDFLGDLRDKRLLFYGSGAHFSLINKFVGLGAEVVAIDISPESIAKIDRAVEAQGLQGRCSTQVMDCEYLTFEDRSFDVVFARSIIHHLDIDRSLKEISRVLKKGGKFTVLEPLGTNPLINCYRYLTPNARTAGEHPLVPGDIRKFEGAFSRTKAHYLYCMSILSYLYRMADGNELRFNRLFNSLCRVDAAVLKLVPGYRHLCWDVLLCCDN